MYNAAIVEDDPAARQNLLDMLEAYQKKRGVKINSRCFENAVILLEGYKPIYDIIFMDIELPLMDGMTAAKKLRAVDTASVLIFVTNMAQYAIKGYEVDALDFVVKPVSLPVFLLKMDKACRVAETTRGNSILVTHDRMTERVNVSRISYIEVADHDLLFHVGKKVLRMHGTLAEVEEKLGSSHFLRCNSCYLVNPRYVRGVKGYTVTVDTDELIISHPRKKAFMQALADYYGGSI